MRRTVALVFGALLTVTMLFSALFAAGCGGNGSPTEKIDKAITKSGDTKSMHADYSVTLDIKGDAAALGSEFEGMLPLSLTVSGGADVDNRGDKPKAKGTIAIEGLDKILSGIAGADPSSDDAQTQLGMSMIGSLFADMEFVLLDEKAYIKMGGSWYETDASTATDMADLGGAATTAGDVDTDCMQNATKDTSRFGATKMLSDIQDKGKEKVNNADASHYTATINLDAFLTELAGAMRECGDAEAAGSIEAVKGELSSMFKTKSIELWIDDDNNIVKVKLDVQLDPAAISDAASSLGGTSTSGTDDAASAAAEGLDSIGLVVTVTMSDFNKDMSITKPEGNIMKLEDLLGGSGLGGDILGGSGMDGLGGTGTTGTSTGSSTSSYSRTATTSSY